MPVLFFWKTWLKDYRMLWNIVGGVFILSVLFLWFSYFRGADGITKWIKIQEQEVIETTVHSFRLGPFEISVPGENYVVFEYFHGSDIVPNVTASYFFLFVLIISAVIILSVITTIERFWFFVGMGLFILFVVSLRLEVLGIFGLYNRLPVITALILFVLPGFYFNRINPRVSFVLRLGLFVVLALAVGVIIGIFSDVEKPFYHLTLTGYISGIILTLLFIIMVAHEVFAAFVNMVSQGSSKSLRHLSIICVVYMGNLLITCFHEMGIIEWNFIYINLYLLLTISAVVGIWGFRQREPLYGNIVAFAPFGGFFFLSLAAIGFATTGQLLGNNNDPALKVIRDAIIFSHTGYGIIFLTYVFSNFVLMLARNLPVHKVLYNPTRMPYFTYRFAGMIAMLGFVFYSNWRTYVYNSTAAFYNTAGDLYVLMGNSAYAESFYEQARSQGFQNNRSNYALATLKSSRLNMEGAHFNYEQANARRPTKYSLINAGNIYLWESDVFSAISQYRQARDVLNGEPVVSNNLGFAYAKVHNLDSALLYLNVARASAVTKTSAETNFFAMAARELIPLKIDSTVAFFGSNDPAVIGNALALSTLQHQEFKMDVQPLSSKTLNLYTATLLNNYIIKYAKSLDTTFVNTANKIASDSSNGDYSEAIKASLAFAYYMQGNVSKALEVLAELAYITQSYQGKFNYIMGLWALEQRNPQLASTYFTYADTYDYKEARFYNAIALSEAGRISEASIAWDTLAGSDDQEMKAIAGQMKNILSLPLAQAYSLGDAEKYQICRYRIGLRDSLTFDRITATLQSDNYRAQAFLDRSRKYLEADMLVPSARYFNRIDGLEVSDKGLFDELVHFKLLLLACQQNVSSLRAHLERGSSPAGGHALERLLFATLVAESKGDTVLARRNYNILGTYNPYFEEGIIAAAEFFRKQSSGRLKAYNILAEAIQINANSIRLLRAYVAEASALGFDAYAASATEQLRKLENSLY